MKGTFLTICFSHLSFPAFGLIIEMKEMNSLERLHLAAKWSPEEQVTFSGSTTTCQKEAFLPLYSLQNTSFDVFFMLAK